MTSFAVLAFSFLFSIVFYFLFLVSFSFHHFFVLVLIFVNEFVIFSFFAIFVFIFIHENHTEAKAVTHQTIRLQSLVMDYTTPCPAGIESWSEVAWNDSYMALHHLPQKTFSVPAASALIEWIVSHSG